MRLPTGPEGSVLGQCAPRLPGGQCARAVCYPLAQAYPLAAWFDTDTERALAWFDEEREERGERREPSPRGCRMVAKEGG
jgi:hypothetical protein